MPLIPPQKNQVAKPAGEAFVWLTGMGLTIGLAMIFSLLALVLIRGLQPFWPKPVVEVTLREGSEDSLQGALTFGGEITLKQKKLSHRSSRAGTNVTEAPLEWQLFVANKDVYGLGFKFVDANQIAKTEWPTNVIKLERLEYGPAIGYPVALEIADQNLIPATNSAFDSELLRLVDEANQRRSEIRRIEKVEIGAISREMSEIALRRRSLERASEGGESVDAELRALAERRAALDEPYDRLESRARELREKQRENSITYRLPSGQERKIPVGQVLHFYYPNELGTFDRAGLFFRNIGAFLSQEPREANTEGGIFPAIFGTFVMTLLMSFAVTPFGVLAAIYLREYATQGPFVRAVRIAVNNLAGVPSIVFGVFGLGFFVYFMGAGIDSLFYADRLPTPTFGTGGILWASLTLALMTVPVVIVATEEALAAVSRGAREGSLACGASKWQTIQRIILPAAAPGILTGLILAMARGAGEVAPLMLVGVVKLAPELPLDLNYPFIHLDQKFMHLGFHIFDLGFQSPDSEAAKPMVFATTLFLIALVVLLNLTAIIIREKLRRKYATGAF
jgi:phosphate transport system permease protein